MRIYLPMTLTLVAAVVAAGCAAESSRPQAPTSPSAPLAALCASTLSLGQTTFPADGGATTGMVTSSVAGCGWTISAPSWLTVTPSTGTGSTPITVSVPYSSGDRRAGSISINDNAVEVVQSTRPLGFSQARCHTPARAGVTVPGACTVTVAPAGDPRSTGIDVTADLRVFGRSATWDFVYITGGEWDVDVPVPAGFAPGVVNIPVTVVDAQGRSATITLPLEVR
jgi:hypothetical protein